MSPSNGRLDLGKIVNFKLQAAIKERDKIILDPTERAEYFNHFMGTALGFDDAKEFITQPFFWDNICYALGTLTIFAQALSEDEVLLGIVRALNQHIHLMHYSFKKGEPAIGLLREEHAGIWQERIRKIESALEMYNKYYSVDDTVGEEEIQGGL